ncbi:helix-turn-helix transcriptional regulator [Nocardia sp. NPDC005366]|uniref:helix-turn-helix transcriptional regulator n=1 Tax=Nocardia sp. NPDC005366 TaxID=3156878 RepID=UPI0033B24525
MSAASTPGGQSRANHRLWQAMTEAGMGPAELAKTVGVDPKTVERWISTGRPPYPVHRHAVGKAVGVDVEQLWPNQTRRERHRSPDSNEVLRDAIYRADLTPDRLAEQLNLNPKSVERWIVKGRLPHARHRAEVAQLVQVPEVELWPEPARALHERLTGNDPVGVWDRWAEQQIRIRADEQRASLGLPTAHTTTDRRERAAARTRALADYAASTAPIKEADIHPEQEPGRYRSYSRGRGVERSR